MDSSHGRLRLFNAAGDELCREESGEDPGVRPLPVCSNPSGLPFGFAGAFRSQTTGLVYMRNRWYSPRLAQFVSRDPLGYVDSYNPYAYVGFDPINFWDPYGLKSGSHAGGARRLGSTFCDEPYFMRICARSCFSQTRVATPDPTACGTA